MARRKTSSRLLRTGSMLSMITFFAPQAVESGVELVAIVHREVPGGETGGSLGLFDARDRPVEHRRNPIQVGRHREPVLAFARSELGEHARFHHLAVVQDGDLIAHHLDLGEQMGVHEQGRAALAHTPQDVPHDNTAERINTLGGLVEKQATRAR